jgi:hypothetical protein
LESTPDGLIDMVGSAVHQWYQFRAGEPHPKRSAPVQMHRDPTRFIAAAAGAVDVLQVHTNLANARLEASQSELKTLFKLAPQLVAYPHVPSATLESHRSSASSGFGCGWSHLNIEMQMAGPPRHLDCGRAG